MGSWNEVCTVSRLPICQGDEVLLVAVRKLKAESDGTYSFACGMGVYNLDHFCLLRKSLDLIHKFSDTLDSDDLLAMKQLEIETDLKEYNPYVFAKFGRYDDYGGLVGDDGVQYRPEEDDAVDYHFFVRKSIWDAIQVEAVKYPINHSREAGWNPPSLLDEQLEIFGWFCYAAGVQLKAVRPLGCQFVEPKTISFIEALNRVTRLELRALLEAQQKESKDFRALEVPTV